MLILYLGLFKPSLFVYWALNMFYHNTNKFNRYTSRIKRTHDQVLICKVILFALHAYF